MTTATTTAIPVPTQAEETAIGERRLWIGNLDLRITEYVLLKLIQRFGKPERFDFMYHVVGPDKGKPKGYCFVTYPTKEMAEKALNSLHGKMALSRRLAVRWAKDKYQNDTMPCSSGLTNKGQESKEENTSQESAENKIRAIEAKLSAMQETQKDFGVSELPAAPPGSNRYSSDNVAQRNKANASSSNRGSYHRRRPYVPNHHRGRRR